jgi:hypothetical protein
VIVLLAASVCGCRDDCVKDCLGRECGIDPECGEPCGSCQTGRVCVEGSCQAVSDPCAPADVIFDSEVDSACTGYENICCLCWCWSQSRQYFDVNEYINFGTCSCVLWDYGPCEGDRLTWAQACVADETTCRASIQNDVHGAQGDCTLTPL